MLLFIYFHFYIHHHKGILFKSYYKTLVAILGVVSRKPSIRSMLSTSLIAEFRAPFVVPSYNYL